MRAQRNSWDLLLRITHREAYRKIRREVSERLKRDLFMPVVDVERLLDETFRAYRRNNRSLLDPGATDLITAGVIDRNYQALEEKFKNHKNRRDLYRSYAERVDSDHRLWYLVPLLSGGHPRDREVILLLGVAGLTISQARTVAKHEDPDYPKIRREIAKAKQNQFVQP